jgi:hypothetical protein
MSKILLSSLIIFGLVLHVFGHGWVIFPIPRGFIGPGQESASQSPPCGLPGNYNGTITVQQNEALDVTFVLGDGHDDNGGPLVCRFAIADTDDDPAAFDANIVANGITCRNSNDDGTVQVPISASPGIKYLQFHWLADSQWYSCIRLNVTPGTIISKDVPFQAWNTVEIEESNQTTRSIYFNLALGTVNDAPNKHLFIKFNETNTLGFGHVNLTASVQTRPYTYTNGNYLTVQSYLQSFSVCTLADGVQNAYVSLFPSYEYSGNVSFYTKIYEAELDFNSRLEIPISAEAGESYLFWTAAYSEQDVPRRIIIVGRGGNAFMSGPYLNCNPIGKVPPTSPNYCTDLPEKIGNQQNTKRYYHVFFDDAYNGEAQVQKGDCRSYSSVESLVFSMILLVVVLFI